MQMCWAVLESSSVFQTLSKCDHVLGLLLISETLTEGSVVVAGQHPTTTLRVINKAVPQLLRLETLWCGVGVRISRELSGRLDLPSTMSWVGVGWRLARDSCRSERPVIDRRHDCHVGLGAAVVVLPGVSVLAWPVDLGRIRGDGGRLGREMAFAWVLAM